MLALTAGGETTIANCAVNDVNFSSKNPASWGVGDNFNRYPYGSFIGATYIDPQATANTGELNHTQAASTVINNSYALNVKNVSNNDKLVYLCGIFYEGNAEKWSYSITVNDVYTDATELPESTNTDPVVKLLVSNDTWNINNTVKTPDTDNFAGLFSNGHWYRGAEANSMPMQKSQTENFAYSYKFVATTPWVSLRTNGNTSLFFDEIMIAPTGEFFEITNLDNKKEENNKLENIFNNMVNDDLDTDIPVVDDSFLEDSDDESKDNSKDDIKKEESKKTSQKTEDEDNELQLYIWIAVAVLVILLLVGGIFTYSYIVKKHKR